MMQRPLTGEPLALDLVNTCWPQGGREVDLLDDDAALLAWLDQHQLISDQQHQRPPGGAYRQPLREVRSAIRGLLERDWDAPERFAAVLAHGRVRLILDGGRPDEQVELDDDSWGPAWASARAYLQLLAAAPPGRIRHCDGAGCVLWFLDSSRNGTRRWCSMTGCGNRAKAQAHYHRQRNAI